MSVSLASLRVLVTSGHSVDDEYDGVDVGVVVNYDYCNLVS